MVKFAVIIAMAILAIVFCVDNTSAGGLDACSQPKDAGLCRAKIPKFFYNTETKQCEQFDWGGCEGNLNNFGDKESCEAACIR
ncbi:Kunitz-type serine protease inhibitor APEKTx1 [Orchesella cincta]|uniref:Kunitz-type serine protease inhibitor APEKTx1 n=1 Tax=Orchesella cincta TaxID=48709 RepID=A0A1D2M2A6_ORCCI|nr:Kunitz-type serine protease inhibitor APEKTx1 [Orchesella cincta]